MARHGYLGSTGLITSTENMEVITTKPDDWTMGYSLYKFTFLNNTACTVKINGGDAIYLRAGQGFQMNEGDKEITSFIVVEADVDFSWVGAY